MTFTGTSVLVATDLSPRCDRAVDRAALLARTWQTRLKVLHVLEEKSRTGRHPTEATVRAVLPDPEMEADILLPTGAPTTVIAATAEQTGSGLIVTGVARFNDVQDYILGTAVDYIIRHADVPVLVVKQRPRDPYRTVLVATDLSAASRAALVRAATLFPDAALHLVHASQLPYGSWLDSGTSRDELQEEVRQQMDAFLAHPDVPQAVRERVQVRLDYGEVAPVIDKALAETGADLLVLGAVGANGLVQAALGSTTASLLAWVPQDTLVVRR